MISLLQSLAQAIDQPWIPWKNIILTFSLAEFALVSYITLRQYAILRRKVVPPQLKAEIDQKTYDKSQAYGRAKAKFGFVQSLFQQAKNVAVITYDFYPAWWALSGSIIQNYAPARFSGEITRSLVFVFTYSWLETIIGLPFSWYSHFVLEEEFGFNKQTVGLWVMDMVKGQALSLVFGAPIGAAFFKIIQKTGDNFFFYIWLFMLLVQLLAISIYPVFIVPLFNTLKSLDAGELKDRVEALARKLNFPLGKLQVIDGSKRSSHSNAYFTGLPFLPKKIVLYDTLIEKSTTPEIEAVLAHELGHWKMGHTLKLLGISSFHLFYIFALFSVFIKNNSLYKAMGFEVERPILIGFLLFNEVLSPTDSIVKFGMNALTRKFEFEADAFSHKLGYAGDLAAALIKLQKQNLSSMDADWMYSAFHYSHPILTERLKAIGWTSEHKVSSEDVNIGGKDATEATTSKGEKKEL